MVYRRRTIRRRPNRRRIVRRSRYVTPNPRSIVRTYAPKVMNFKRSFYSSNWTFSTASTAGFYATITTQLGFVPNSTEWTNLFKQYRIKAMKWTFVPRFDNVPAADSTNAPLGTLYVAQNREAAAVSGTYSATTLNSLLEKPHKRLIMNGNRSYYMKTNTIVDNEITYNKWLTTAATTVTYFGFDVYWAFPVSTPITSQSIDLFCTVYLQCKGIK